MQSQTLRRLDNAKSLFELHADNVTTLSQKITKLTDEQKRNVAEERRLTGQLEILKSDISKIQKELDFKNRERREQEIKMGLAANSVQEYKRKLDEEIEQERKAARLSPANDNRKSFR